MGNPLAQAHRPMVVRSQLIQLEGQAAADLVVHLADLPCRQPLLHRYIPAHRQRQSQCDSPWACEFSAPIRLTSHPVLVIHLVVARGRVAQLLLRVRFPHQPAVQPVLVASVLIQQLQT